MDDFQLTEEDKVKGQQEINTWFENLPVQTAELLDELKDKVSQMETFDLLSNISFYNHIHDAQEYTDYRGDKMFVVSELITLIALKQNYVSRSVVDMADGLALFKKVQELGNRYFALMTMLQMKDNRPDDDHSMAGIAFRTMRDETTVRNPALPEHHLIFSAELYAPIDAEIKKKFGFSVKESITIREAIVTLINERVNKARDEAEQKAIELFMEIFRYRATKTVPENSTLSKENLEELNQLSRKKIKEACYNYCMNDMLFRLGEIYCFTAKDLSDFTGHELPVSESFVRQFSCGFPCVKEQDLLVGPTHILKSKPLVEHNGRILIPSMPLLTWCVEPVIEDYIKSVQKMQDRFKSIKHDFLLKKGTEFFSTIFKNEVEIFTNLYYYEEDNKQSRCETDGIFNYERTLFIMEAKGHRISQPAKEGKIVRTEKHMEQIVRDSYEQGLRTLNYIRNKPEAEFLTEKNKTVKFSRDDFDEIILVSLILEPIGNVTPLIRTTNELGFFKQDIFPWIISIYDLQVIADHLELPVLLPHYIKRRREFLSRKIMHIFEEIDLLSYYLFNRLYIERMFREAEEENANMVYLDNETDAINNYYMHKFRRKNPDPPKLTLKLPDLFKKILVSVEKSRFSHRQDIMMGILDLSPPALEKFKNYIEKIKRMFLKDGKIHDCSILTELWGKKIGFTFMTGTNKIEIDQKLYFYCQYKIDELKANVWIGFGDTNRSIDQFDIQSGLVATQERN